jgi:hypothetical protein
MMKMLFVSLLLFFVQLVDIPNAPTLLQVDAAKRYPILEVCGDGIDNDENGTVSLNLPT